jgi:hypothetical protein
MGFGCLIALHWSSSFLQSKFPPAPRLRRGENWPRRSAERSRVAGDPRVVRPFRPRRRWGCLIAPQQSRQSLQSHYTLSRLLRCSENWPRLSAERSRVAGAPRGPGSGRSSRPHRGWGSGAQARSQRRSPASRPRRVRVVGSGQACAGFTVVSAVGTGPPHDGPSRDRPSKVSGAVRDGRRPIGGMASPTSPAGTSQVSDDGRNAGTRRSAHGLYS